MTKSPRDHLTIASPSIQTEVPSPSRNIPDLVSVVVPVYKVEGLLPRCIDSVLNQTYSNFELILIDDGSPDGSGKICDEYAATDSRVTVVHQPNGGLSAARNAGLEAAHGEFITFIDSDDWISPNYIEVLLRLISETNSEIAIGSFLKTSENHLEPAAPPAGHVVEELTTLEALNSLYGQGAIQMTVAWGKLFRQHLFTNVKFPVGRIHEDVFTSCQLICATKSIVITTQPLYFCWQRADSIMHTLTATPQSRRDRLDGFADNVEVLRAAGFDHHATLALIRAILAYSRLCANHPPSNGEGGGRWTRGEAERLRRSLAERLSQSDARPRLRLYLRIHLYVPRLGEAIALRIR